MSSVFFLVLWPLYTGRQTYAKKGSLRGGVLFGVAYAGGYARIFSPAGLKKSALSKATLVIVPLLGLLWLHFLSFWPFVASFRFILVFVPSTKLFGLCC